MLNPEHTSRHPWIAYFADDRDARRLTRAGLVCNGLAYLHYLIVIGDLIAPWTLVLTLPILVPRWMIAVHELFHLRNAQEVDTVTRRLPFVFTFLALGYHEQYLNHRSHHRYTATPADGDYYQLSGNKLWGLFNAMTAPEQMWFRWVSKHGLTQILLYDTLLRLGLLLLLMISGGWLFLWYWVPARISFGLSYFTFFYCLHRRGAAYGVYPLRLPGWLRGPATWIYGHDVVEATMHHDVHHAQPRIATIHFKDVREGVMGETQPSLKTSASVADERVVALAKPPT